MFPAIAVRSLLTLSCLQHLSPANCAARIDQVVLRHLEKFPTTSVLVKFGAHHIKRAIDNHRSTRSKDPAHKLTEPEVTAYIDNLNRISNEYQASVLAYLQSSSCGANYPKEFCKNIDYFQLWISNEIVIRNADRALLNQVASMPNVTDIRPDQQVLNYMCGSSPPKPKAMYYPPITFNLDMLHIKELWDKGITGENVTVGIIDSGVSVKHPHILAANYRGHEYGWMDSTFDNCTSPVDPDPESHGTCILSLAVGKIDDDHIPVGVAPDAEWMACKLDSSLGLSPLSAYRICMTWMACPTLPDGSNRDCTKRPTVVNHSVGESHELEANYYDVYETVNILVVVAAGNTGPSCEFLPSESELDWPIVVGNVDHNRKLLPHSSRGPSKYGRVRPHLVAPGEYARCLNRDKVKNQWFRWSRGTSCAAPHVVGVVALIKSYKPELTAAQLKSVVIRGSWSNHSRELGQECGNRTAMSTPNNLYGYGITNAYEAYCLAKKNKFLSIDELLDWGIQKYESPCE